MKLPLKITLILIGYAMETRSRVHHGGSFIKGGSDALRTDIVADLQGENDQTWEEGLQRRRWILEGRGAYPEPREDRCHV